MDLKEAVPARTSHTHTPIQSANGWSALALDSELNFLKPVKTGHGRAVRTFLHLPHPELWVCRSCLNILGYWVVERLSLNFSASVGAGGGACRLSLSRFFRDPGSMYKIQITTEQRDQFVEITDQVRKIVARSPVQQGIVTVYSLHTTAGITINENADPDVVHDMLLTLNRLIPQETPGFRHAERNSDSHVKASMMGSSCHLIIDDGQLVLGTWQGIYFCEFDGPRQRTVIVNILAQQAEH